jgi:hypothetical protein
VKDLIDADTEIERKYLAAKAQYERWSDDIKALAKVYKVQIANVREALCENDEDDIETETQRVADQVASVLDRELDDLDARSIEILKLVQDVVADSKWKSKGNELREELNKRMSYAADLLLGTRQGFANPRLRTRIEVGKNEHKRIQADSSKCTVSEVTLESYRFDCVLVESKECQLVEIKPDNEKARRRGEQQLEKYVKAVQQRFDGKGVDGFDDSEKLKVFKRCVHDGKLKLEAQLRVYNFCPSDFKIGEDFVIP